MSTTCKIILGGVPMSLDAFRESGRLVLVLKGTTSNPDEVLDDVKRVFSDCSIAYFYYDREHLLRVYIW